eukprot:8754730-Alexandrium_andersonii.AAC.1
MLPHVALCCPVLPWIALGCPVLPCVALCCPVLPCVAARFSCPPPTPALSMVSQGGAWLATNGRPRFLQLFSALARG